MDGSMSENLLVSSLIEGESPEYIWSSIADKKTLAKIYIYNN